MPRLAISLLALAAAMGPALAADWNESPETIYRDAYSIEPYQWTDLGDTDDGISIETGLRYWYSWGAQSMGLGGGDYDTEDTTHAIEGYLRIDDEATSTYAKGWIGYSAAINGDYDNPDESGEIVDGKLAYGGGDFGWYAVGDDKNRAGAFVGYNYWNNSPRTARAEYTTATTSDDIIFNDQSGVWSMPGDSADDNFDLHMLRLGLSGKAEINEFFDITAEVAAVPFATISGTIGGHADKDLGPFAGCATACASQIFKASPTGVEGWGYGGMAEVMAGIHPTENLTLRLGGRAWYVEGTYDASYRRVTVNPPVYQEVEQDGEMVPANPPYSSPTLSADDYTITENPFSLLRYGLLAELTYSF